MICGREMRWQSSGYKERDSHSYSPSHKKQYGNTCNESSSAIAIYLLAYLMLKLIYMKPNLHVEFNQLKFRKPLHRGFEIYILGNTYYS